MDSSETTVDAGSIKAEGGNVGGLESPKWMSSLPDAYKEDARFKQFEEPSKAWNKFASLLDAEGKMVQIPGEDSTNEVKNSFFTKLGRPGKPEEYTFKIPDSAPKELFCPEIDSLFKSLAFDTGLSDKQLTNLYSGYIEIIMKADAEMQVKEKAATEKTIDVLKNEWKGDDFKMNVALAHKAFKEFSNDDVQEFIENTKVEGVALGDHPIFLKLFANIAKSIMNDNALMDKGVGTGVLSDEERAQRRFPVTYDKKK